MKQTRLFEFAMLVVISLQAILSSESFTISGRTCTTPSFVNNEASQSSSSPKRAIVAVDQSKHQRKSPFQLNDATDGSRSSDENDISPLPTYGGLVGKLTGLSFTAFRKSIRTTTGLSITATRTALRGLTGVSVTASMKMLFGIFPPWFRYFLQPLFILYYTPLMITKYFIGATKTSKEEAYATHEKIVEGWKDAIRAAEQAQESWPLHVTDDGKIESLTPQSIPIADAIVESLDVASTVQEQDKDKK